METVERESLRNIRGDSMDSFGNSDGSIVVRIFLEETFDKCSDCYNRR